MNKSTRIVKRLLALFLVVLMSINSFAAVVGDNDGSAFITKAEFDSLKNDFQAQIDQYNTSIDSKIDGAIAGYLAGIRISDEPTDYYDKVMTATGGQFRFLNTIPGTGSSTLTTDFKMNVNNYVGRKIDNVYGIAGSRSSDSHGMDYLLSYSPDKAWADNIVCWNIDTYGAHYWREKTAWVAAWSQASVNQKYLTSYRNNWVDATKFTSDGEGSAWVFHNNPNGTDTLTSYSQMVYPVHNIDVNRFRYKNFDTSGNGSNTADFIKFYTTATGMDMTTEASQTVPVKTSWGIDIGGTSVDVTTSEVADQLWYSNQVLKIQVDNGVDYTVLQWGNNVNRNVYVVRDNQECIADTVKTEEAQDNYIYEIYYPPNGIMQRTTTISGVAVTYTPIKLVPTLRNLSLFTNQYLTSVSGETVYIGGGAPLFATSDGDQTVKVKLHGFLENTSGKTTGTINYFISNKQFVNGSVAGDGTILKSGTCAITNSDGSDIEFELECSEKGIYWINAYASSVGQMVGFENTSFKLK